MGTIRALLIGRFQPPHCGHAYLLKWCLDRFDEVIIAVGSAQESYTIKNPFTTSERLEMLRLMMRDLDIPLERVWIIPIQDIAMNAVWVRYVETMMPKFQVVVTRNPLVKKLFKDYGYPVLSPPSYKREECSGTRIRELMLKGSNEWERLVTPSVAKYIKSIGGVERIILLAHGD